jgi:hypothetical protein
VPLQRLLTELACQGGPHLTISATDLASRHRSIRCPWWLREVYAHLAWIGLPVYDVTAGLVGHLLIKTYARRAVRATGNCA